MKALITGAGSGIGREMAIYLDSISYDLILVDKDSLSLEYLKGVLKREHKYIVTDLSDVKKVKDLYIFTKKDDIDMLINNAGFGLFGDYNSCDMLTELEMIDVNIKALHVLTRMYLKDMVKKDKGYILNVGSSAGLLRGGPLMNCYYASKSYVVTFTCALYEELRRNKSHVVVSCLCPGPVSTNFNETAGVSFNIKSLNARYVAIYGLKKMYLDKKLIIVPGFMTRVGVFISRFLPVKLLLKITYNIQRKKGK